MLLGILMNHCWALELPDEVQQILDEVPHSAQQAEKMTLPDILEKILTHWNEQCQQPLRRMIRCSVFLIVGAAASALAPSEQWNACLETVILAGSFLFFAQPVVDLMGQVVGMIQDWYTYLVGFVPAFAGVMLSSGQSAGAAVYSGMFLAMANFSAQLIGIVAMPLLQVHLALCVASGLSGVDGLQEGCSLLRGAVQWALKGVSVLFGTVLGFQTILARGRDGALYQAGRSMIRAAIPVVGAAASDAMGSVLAALGILKSSMGVAAVAALTVAFLPLLLRCIACTGACSLCAVMANACGLPRSGEVLKGISRSVGLCISFLVFFFMLVVLTTALMILTGG